MAAASTMSQVGAQAPAKASAAAGHVQLDLLLGMPSVLATRFWPAPGFCVGAHSSITPSCHQAVQFCGSMLAWR